MTTRCQNVNGVCPSCGRPFSRPNLIRNCRPGLGDLVAAGLASVGITKARAQAVAAAVGIEDCGCQGRQEAWNLAGYRLGIGTPPPADFGPTG